MNEEEEWDDFDIPDFDDDIDDDNLGVIAPSAKPKHIDEEKIKSIALKTKHRHIMRRAISEQVMNDTFDWHLEEGYSYHVISSGDIDFLTYVRGVIKNHKLDYLAISTWVIAEKDALEIEEWLLRGLVGRVDIYVGEVFAQSRMMTFDKLVNVIPTRGGRVCMNRNHMKVAICYHGKTATVVESSANVNTNPRIEQTVLTVDRNLADFYKEFLDSLKPQNEWKIPWKPWEEPCPRRERTETFMRLSRMKTGNLRMSV